MLPQQILSLKKKNGKQGTEKSGKGSIKKKKKKKKGRRGLRQWEVAKKEEWWGRQTEKKNEKRKNWVRGQKKGGTGQFLLKKKTFRKTKTVSFGKGKKMGGEKKGRENPAHEKTLVPHWRKGGPPLRV